MQRCKNTLIWLAIRAVVWSLQKLPLWLCRSLARAIGTFAFWVAGRDRHRALEQIAQAFPEKPVDEHRQIVRAMFKHLALCAFESVHMATLLHEQVELSPENRAVLDEAMAHDKGVVAVTGHIGNWELLAQVVAHAGYPATTIARPVYDPRLTRLIHKHRTAWGLHVIWRGDNSGAKDILRVFRERGMLALLIDQDTKVQGTFVPFFGRLAYTPTAAASLALRTGAPILLGYTYRQGNRHLFHFETFCAEVEGDREQAIERITAELTKRLEDAIRQHPEQWVWFHKRWKSQPPSGSFTR